MNDVQRHFLIATIGKPATAQREVVEAWPDLSLWDRMWIVYKVWRARVRHQLWRIGILQ
jgi:hypothetical protein